MKDPATLLKRTALAAILALCLLPSARAERVPMSPEELQRHATHIVVGEVQAVYARKLPVRKGFEDTHFVAELRVKRAEKGDGLETNGLVYVRYWTRAWKGILPPPPDTAGYREVPKEGETLRVFLTRGGYNGFGTTQDGGFTVLGPNGFDRTNQPKEPAKQ